MQFRRSIDTSAAGRGLPRPAAGFTIIELMIAIGILAIVAAIAIPNYRQYVLESGRAEAQAVSLQVAQQLERCYTRYSAYNDNDCALGDGDTVDSENGKYRVTVDSAANTFTLTTTPLGTQANDSECAEFTLTHTGARTASPGGVDECW
ncbi:MAG: type IV pilin protein [Wenzhouxiangellaceae bacterium]|nr:type IV pilin protein [Wenzhouxiangellaceae bacterium]